MFCVSTDYSDLLSFGHCHVACPVRETFTLMNHSSSNQVVRFEWPSEDSNLTFSPQVNTVEKFALKVEYNALIVYLFYLFMLILCIDNWNWSRDSIGFNSGFSVPLIQTTVTAKLEPVCSSITTSYHTVCVSVIFHAKRLVTSMQAALRKWQSSSAPKDERH